MGVFGNIQPKVVPCVQPASIKDIFLHALFARVALSDNSVLEFQTKYDQACNQLELLLPQDAPPIFDKTNGIQPGPNLIAFVDWLINNSLPTPTPSTPPSVVVNFVQTADGFADGSSGEKEIDSPGSGTGSLTFPADYFTAGKNIGLNMRGFYSEVGNPSLTVKIKLNSTVILDTGAVQFTGNSTDEEWGLLADITCRSIGVNGTVIGQGRVLTASQDVFGMTNTTPITIDTTIPQTISVTARWSNGANASITSTNFIVQTMAVQA